jgi:hypothetical protein
MERIIIYLHHSGPASEDKIILIALSLLEILNLVFCRDDVGLSIFSIMGGLGNLKLFSLHCPFKRS